METSRIDNQVPFMAIHPAEIIKDEIKERGMSQRELAERLGMQASNVSRMLRGKETITSALAAKLEKALGIKSSFWLNAQAEYDKDILAIEQRNEKEQVAADKEYMLSSLLNMKELYAKLKIRTSLFVQEKLDALSQIFGMEPAEIPYFQLAYNGNFKKSDKVTTDEKNQRTWQVLAYVSAKHNKPTNKYEKGNANKAAIEIASAAHKGGINEEQIKEILNLYGISYSYVSKLEKAPIDAYSSWVNDYPAIVTTHRYNDICKLVFNVIHELGHIELHIKPNTNVAYISDGAYSTDQKEEEANKFAEDILIAPDVWKDIVNTSSKGIGVSNIVHHLKVQAKEKGLDAGLVMWRYKFETHKYALRGASPEKITRPVQENFI